MKDQPNEKYKVLKKILYNSLSKTQNVRFEAFMVDKCTCIFHAHGCIKVETQFVEFKDSKNRNKL
jgi:hypothetical protein